MYADDTAILAHHKNLSELNINLQEHANMLEKWCADNRLNINVSKSKVMYFPPGRRHRNNNLTISIEGTTLEQVCNYRYLGYIIDQELSFTDMLNKTLNKLNNTLRIFRMIRQSLTTRAAIMVFKAKVLSLLDYILIFTYTISKKNFKKLQTIQNNFIRCTMKLPKRTNVDHMHCHLNILHVTNRRYLLLMKYMYYKSRFTHIEETAPQRITTRQMEKITFSPNTPTTDKFANSLAYTGPTLWNNLSSEEQFLRDAQSFKNVLKKRLLESEKALYDVPINRT